ncbi:MAG TPA: hypothetical protein VMV74_01710 [Bacteroidales bacterium]|nr:hypothetical protein [Bacteroidales bacterium]
MIRISIILLSALLFASCARTNKENERIAVARAGDRLLYFDEVPATLVVPGMSKPDSISAVQSYVRRWARKEFLAIRAEQNLTSEYKAEVNRQLDEMRNNLLIYQYQQQMIIQKMDTAVTDSELQEYYITNINTFALTSNIVKAFFFKLPKEAPDLDKVRGWYKSNAPEDYRALENYCLQFALRYDDFNETWISFAQLLMEMPLESDDQEAWLTRNSAVELQDDKFLYFINIREYRLRNSVAPFEYIRNQVKTIILNNRRNDFLQKLEDGIYNEALRDNSLTVY